MKMVSSIQQISINKSNTNTIMKDGYLEAKDLMIGDLVREGINGRCLRVVHLQDVFIEGKDEISLESGYENNNGGVYPIPLTPEILEMNGFVLDKRWGKNIDFRTYNFPNNEDLYHRGFGLEYRKHNYEDEYVFYITDHQLMPIRYVHELQRLLRSCEGNGLRSLADNFKV